MKARHARSDWHFGSRGDLQRSKERIHDRKIGCHTSKSVTQNVI
jgi:hypothetical protein